MHLSGSRPCARSPSHSAHPAPAAALPAHAAEAVERRLCHQAASCALHSWVHAWTRSPQHVELGRMAMPPPVRVKQARGGTTSWAPMPLAPLGLPPE